MPLDEYKRKRKFDSTPEPGGKLRRRRGRSFVIQKHHASRLHYDLRLEMEGVLRSWAVPKGPSLNPREKRLAIQTEDHPVDYGGFEGVIPEGNYGAGKVIVWDRGDYEMVDPPTAEEGWENRKFHFVLQGEKLSGEWVLVKTGRAEKEWLFFKVRDDFAAKVDITVTRPESVVSGLRVEQVGEALSETRTWNADLERELETRGVKKERPCAIPEKVAPMLATLIKEPFDNDEWLFEIKMDGIRAVVFKNGGAVDLRSRNDRAIGRRFPGIVSAVRSLAVDSVVLDVEIVALDEDGRSRFNLIQPRIHLSGTADVNRAERETPVFFYVFDLLYISGYSVTGFSLEARKALLRALIPDDTGWVRYSDHVDARGREFFDAAESHHLEGIVAKRRESTYHQRRSPEWLKVKTTQSEDFVVTGFTPPAGSRKHFGALALGLYEARGNLVYVGRVGAGFDDEGLASTYALLKTRIRKKSPFRSIPSDLSQATWVKPDLVCEVRFNEWTREGKLRAPVFLRLREDIDPRDSVLREEPGETGETVAEASPVPEVSLPGPAASRVQLTNPGKIFWPRDGLTKGDLVHYYGEIADVLNPYLSERPLVLKRYPDGITGEHFYQKDAPDYTPDWLRTERLWSEDTNKYTRYFVGGEGETLIYLANMGAITQNPWSSRLGSLEHPDYVIFDLDPSEDVPYMVIQRVAREIKKILDELELRAYPKTSGASGLHIYLPLLEGRFTYSEVRRFAHAVASVVVERVPDLATIERSVGRRPRGVYIDFLQNVKGKTVASVYSARARPGAPVSTPLRWEELRRRIDPGKFTIRNILRRLKRMGDLFEPVLKDRQDIAPFIKALG